MEKIEYSNFCVKCHIEIIDITKSSPPLSYRHFVCHNCQNTYNKTPHSTILCKCGRDLTTNAHSDFRAEDFIHNPEYLCDQCFEQEIQSNPINPDDSVQFLNQYDTITYLGKGPYGTVYKVRDSKTKRIVSLKILQFEVPKDDYLTTYYRVFRYSAINHPNIAHLYDFHIDENSLYYIYEFVNGIPSDQYFKHVSDSNLLLKILSNIVSALQCLEFHRLSHLNIKPSNIFITQTDPPIAIISDLGLMETFNQRSTLKSSISRLNRWDFDRLYFIPKDMLIRFENGGLWADIYGLGISSFFLISHHLPFLSKRTGFSTPLQLENIIDEIVNEKFDFFSETQQTNQDIYQLIEKMICTKADQAPIGLKELSHILKTMINHI